MTGRTALGCHAHLHRRGHGHAPGWTEGDAQRRGARRTVGGGPLGRWPWGSLTSHGVWGGCEVRSVVANLLVATPESRISLTSAAKVLARPRLGGLVRARTRRRQPGARSSCKRTAWREMIGPGAGARADVSIFSAPQRSALFSIGIHHTRTISWLALSPLFRDRSMSFSTHSDVSKATSKAGGHSQVNLKSGMLLAQSTIDPRYLEAEYEPASFAQPLPSKATDHWTKALFNKYTVIDRL